MAGATVNGQAVTGDATNGFTMVAGDHCEPVPQRGDHHTRRGAGDNLTVTALDAFGNTATTYTGSHNLTYGGAVATGGHNPTVTNSTGTAITFGNTTRTTFTNGVANVTGPSNGVMTLYKLGTSLITVSDGTFNNGTGLSVTVTGGAADEPHAQRRRYDADSRRRRQPDHHRGGRVRQHRRDLHRIEEPDLQRGERHRLVLADGHQRHGHGRQLRFQHGHHLHQRCRPPSRARTTVS